MLKWKRYLLYKMSFKDLKFDYPSYEWELEEPRSKHGTEEVKETVEPTVERKRNVWQDIIREREELLENIKQLQDLKEQTKPIIPEEDSASTYLNKEVFPMLLPALEKTLFKAQEMDCIKHQKSRFSGLDYLSEVLWNSNPLHPERTEQAWKDIFSIPFVKSWLKDNPRPVYPKSWLWTREEAAVIIQSHYRGHLVRCREDVQELRSFWKVLAKEKEEATILTDATETTEGEEEDKDVSKQCIT